MTIPDDADAAAPGRRLEIEFCTKCRFGGRAFFLARELFDQRPELFSEIALVPSTNGVFRVRYGASAIWDYPESADRFPEPKEVREAILRQRGLLPTQRSH